MLGWIGSKNPDGYRVSGGAAISQLFREWNNCEYAGACQSPGSNAEGDPGPASLEQGPGILDGVRIAAIAGHVPLVEPDNAMRDAPLRFGRITWSAAGPVSRDAAVNGPGRTRTSDLALIRGAL